MRDRQIIAEVAGGPSRRANWLLLAAAAGFAVLVGWSLYVLAKAAL